MEKNIIDYLINFLKNLPIHAQVLFLTIIGPLAWLGYHITKNKDFRTDILMFAAKTNLRRDKLDRGMLLKHDLFLSRPLFNRYISNILFKEKDKEWLFDTILKHKIDHVISSAEHFIRNNHIETDSALLKFQMNELLDNMISAYEAEILTQFIQRYGHTCGNELFDYVYYEGFRKYHNNNVKHILTTIDKLSSSSNAVNFKLYSFLLNLYIALDMAIYDCEQVFKDFNGHITDIIKKYQ